MKPFRAVCQMMPAAVLALALAAPASAQVTESFEVEVLAPPVTIDLGECSEGSFSGQVYAGSTIQCSFTAIDGSGEPTVASIVVESSDSSIATAEMVDGSTAEIEFLAPGTVTIIVTASELEIAIGMLEERWDSTSAFALDMLGDELATEVGDTVRMCAYVIETHLVDGAWRSLPTVRSHAMCPMAPVGAEFELPVSSFDWSSSDTTVIRFLEEDPGAPAGIPLRGYPSPAGIRFAAAGGSP